MLQPCQPCPAWPLNRAQLKEFRASVQAMVADYATKQPEPPKPKPLAVIPSRLPITEMMARLPEIQSQHLDAQVHDAINFRALGIVGQPPIDWQNRPTFQQVIQFPRRRPR